MRRLLVAVIVAVPMLALLLPAFLIVGALLLFAACVRALARRLEPQFVPWKDLIAVDPALGWKPRPHLDVHYLADRDDVFRLVTDGDGWPGTHSIEESAIVAIGDSFAFGYGVDTAKSFACVKNEPRIKAIGAPGYSMVQSLLLTEQLAPRLAGKVVVWLVCLENDLEDNLSPSRFHYRSPFVRPARAGAWEIMRDHVSSEPWRCTVWSELLFPYLCVPGPLADRVFAASDYIVNRAAACCARAGARLVIFTVPTPMQLTDAGRAMLGARSGRPDAFDPYLPDRRLRETSSRYDVMFASGLEYLSASDYKSLEGIHWNEHGHRRVADFLTRLHASMTSGLNVHGSVSSVAETAFPARERVSAQA